MKALKKMTLTEKLLHIFPNEHPFLVSAIVQAIDEKSKEIIQRKDEVIEANKNSFVSGELWVQIHERMQEFVNENK